MTFLLDNSISLIALLVVLFLGISRLKAEMKKRKMKIFPFLKLVRQRLHEMERAALSTLIAVGMLNILVSLIVFRCLWSNLAFDSLLIGLLVYSKIKFIIEDIIN